MKMPKKKKKPQVMLVVEQHQPHNAKRKKKKKRNERQGAGRVDGSWDGTVFLGFISGSAVDELRLVHMVHTNPLFARENDPKVSSQTTPLSTVAGIHQRYRLTRFHLRLIRMVTNTAYTGSNLYVWHNKTPGLMTAQPSLDALLATRPTICTIGDTVEHDYPSTQWRDVNTAATDVNDWEEYTVQIYITGKTYATFYQAAVPFAGNLWMAYVDLHYDFQEVRPTSLSILSNKDVVANGAKVVTLGASSDAPGALALQVSSTSLLGRMLTAAGDNAPLTAGQLNAIWEIGDAVVNVVSSFLGSFGWILKGGWFVVRRHYHPAPGLTATAVTEEYLIYPSLVQAQQGNYLTGTPGQDVATLSGTVAVQQLTNPNWAGEGGTQFAGGRPTVAYPIMLPRTPDEPPLPAAGQYLSCRTWPGDSAVSPTESTDTYTWTMAFRSGGTYSTVGGNPQMRGAISGTTDVRYKAILDTQMVVSAWDEGTTDQLVLWKGSAATYVNYLIEKDRAPWRTGPPSRYVYGVCLNFPITGNLAGAQVQLQSCWVFFGRAKTSEEAAVWECVYFKPGTEEIWKWPTSDSDWTLKHGAFGPPMGFSPGAMEFASTLTTPVLEISESDNDSDYETVQYLASRFKTVRVDGKWYVLNPEDGTITLAEETD